MDTISRVLETIRVRAPLLAQVRFGPNSGLDMLEGVGSPFYYVMDGDIDLAMDEATLSLRRGDLAIVSTWSRHRLLCGSPEAVPTIVDVVEAAGLPLWTMREGMDGPLMVDLGGSAVAAHVISGNFVMDLAEGAFLSSALPAVLRFSTDDPAIRASLEPSIRLVLDTLTMTEPGFAAAAARALELLFIQALRRWLLHSDHVDGWARGMATPSIRRVLEAMYADPGRDWTLSGLAEQANQSRSTFADAFKATLGETPFIHLRRYRMIRAAARLRHSRASVAEIAAELGYSSTHAFVRAFRQEMQKSPSAYRRDDVRGDPID